MGFTRTEHNALCPLQVTAQLQFSKGCASPKVNSADPQEGGSSGTQTLPLKAGRYPAHPPDLPPHTRPSGPSPPSLE